MRPVTLTTSDASGGTVNSSIAVMDFRPVPFNVGFGLNITGTATCTVQHTFDDPYAVGFDAATAKWYDHPDVTGDTADVDGNYAFPVRAIRLQQTAGAGSAALTLVQAGW